MSSIKKVKSPAKVINSELSSISGKVLKTMKIISDVVGSTLGPSGRPVLLESDSYGKSNSITKDGVSVFRALGFKDPTMHAIMESARDAATKTVAQAGDGPQPLWSKVLTPTGFVNMGDLKPGMVISGTNGTKQEVVEVFEKGQREIVKVHFAGGHVVECCPEHLWFVRIFNKTNSNVYQDENKGYTLMTKEIGNYIDSLKYTVVTPSLEGTFSIKNTASSQQIVKIENTGKYTEMRCIKVSNPDRLYITDNFIVTHNTTTATVLSYAIVKNTIDFCRQNPTYTPQKVVREMEAFFKNVVDPFVAKHSIKRPEGDEGAFNQVLEQVAAISANGDTDLAQKVMQCFDIAGDEGAITIVEQSGPSEYVVEHIDGFSIEQGFENSMGRFFPLFINDKANNRVVVDKPVFILYGNAITEPQTIQLLCEKIGQAWASPGQFGLDKPFNHNVILVAPSFSESVLASLAANFATTETINVIPLACQKSSIQHSELHFLQDLAAITGATVFDPITRPMQEGTLQDLGYGIENFEMTRFRSNVIGYCEKDLVLDRIEELKTMLKSAESKFDAQLLEDRIARLGGGIAKLKIMGSSSAELREKRDRAEDAVAAVRGAIKNGALPGGGWSLAKLSELATGKVGIFVIAPSLLYPIQKLLENCGLTSQEVDDLIPEIIKNAREGTIIYDAMNSKFISAQESGIYDSAPAVLEAIRNSFSIAGILGTLGGLVVFERDDELERQEASETNHFMQTVGMEP